MQDYELDAYHKVWKNRENRTDRRIASFIAAISNAIYGAQGRQSNFKADDFLGGQSASRPLTAEELLNRAIVAFGPPPTKS